MLHVRFSTNKQFFKSITIRTHKLLHGQGGVNKCEKKLFFFSVYWDMSPSKYSQFESVCLILLRESKDFIQHNVYRGDPKMYLKSVSLSFLYAKSMLWWLKLCQLFICPLKGTVSWNKRVTNKHMEKFPTLSTTIDYGGHPEKSRTLIFRAFFPRSCRARKKPWSLCRGYPQKRFSLRSGQREGPILHLGDAWLNDQSLGAIRTF
jgi:hypothetical protein